MAKRFVGASASFVAAPRLAVTTLVLCPLIAWCGSHKKSAPAEPPPVRATLKPTATIPIEPLGFSAPATFYLGTRNSLISLDFLDEDRLLLTFRVPGLIHRDHPDVPTPEHQDRQVRVVVLHIPDGAVQAETVWTLHDRRRYLWMLDNGQFLLRDRDELKLGDASLQLKPFLRFPGPVLWIELDPNRKYVVTGSSEPPTSASKDDEVVKPPAAGATLVSDDPKPATEPDLVLRILRRDSGKVMLVTHVKSAVHLPINSDGFLETLRGNGKAWLLNLTHFDGGSTILGSVDSFCSPMLDFASPREFLATTCQSDGDPRVVAMTTGGRRLWENSGSGSMIWPVLITGGDGLRIARETLMVNHGVNAFAPLGTEDIKGQDVQVFDAATGKVVLRAQASPVFDVGGNVAISPSGLRAAIIMADSLQVFDLPPAPPLPSDSAPTSKH
ncbi:MAG TPA: hypothetical protein VGL00_05605 [Terracidiphilus sp.]